MNVWFCILIGIHVLNLGIELGKHGEKETKTHNFFTSLVGSAIGVTLLYLAVKTGF